MEQWKMSVLTGAALIVLALLFSLARGEFTILMGLVVVLGIVDILFGIYRKKKEGI